MVQEASEPVLSASAVTDIFDVDLILPQGLPRELPAPRGLPCPRAALPQEKPPRHEVYPSAAGRAVPEPLPSAKQEERLT